MILVVSPHILVFGCSHSLGDDFSLGGNNFLSFNSLFVLFHMPLFFFISGFLLYKKDFEWNLQNMTLLITKKAKSLLIPTLFFLFIYTFITDASFIDCFCKSSKWGYWFTVALFEYFVIYVLYRFICNLLGKKNGIDWILIIGSLMLYFMVTPSCLRWLNIIDTITCGIIGLENLKYFLFLLKAFLNLLSELLLLQKKALKVRLYYTKELTKNNTRHNRFWIKFSCGRTKE